MRTNLSSGFVTSTFQVKEQQQWRIPFPRLPLLEHEQNCSALFWILKA